ncbi:MAG: alpha/beta hydrolase [Epsilonproteobacteria bacterium]|nr:alpha/beta hydrolase [Campylobacterota bacterium]
MKSIVLKMFLLIIGLYIVISYYLYATQEQKIFNSKRVEKIEPKIAKKIEFKSSDGVVLEGGLVENKKGAPLVLYFGGNGSNVIWFLDMVASKIKDFNFIAFNYPGYGNSLGKPSEETILKYAQEIYKKYNPSIVVGRSLGSAVAIYVASKNPVKGLVLITPIDSIVNIAKARYPFLLVDYLVKHKFEANRWAKDIKAKVAVILVENENIVPKKSIENILNELKDKIVYKATIKEANHIDIYSYEQTIKELEKALKAVK